MFLSGCVSKFSVEKANTYLLSHPERPAQIKEAIAVGEVVPGMTEEEVIICLGKPDIITTNIQSYPVNMELTFWRYFNSTRLNTVNISFRDGIVSGINASTQKGMIVMPYPNTGPIIRSYPGPGGTFNSDPIVSPTSQNVIVGPRPVVITPTVVKKNCSK